VNSNQGNPFAKDMAANNGDKKASKIANLRAHDAEFLAAHSLEAVNEAKRQPGLRMAEVVKIVMEGNGDRPALGQRARQYITDPNTGATTSQLLPRFETISYRQLWHRACSLAAALYQQDTTALRPGDFVCILGFASIDYAAQVLANIHIGAVNVPLQTSAPTANHIAIIAETEAKVLAVGIDYLDRALAALAAPSSLKQLVVFDVDPNNDVHSEQLASAKNQLLHMNAEVVLASIDALVSLGQELPPAPLFVPPASTDPLAWLFYTSGSTGTPKGAMLPQSLTIKSWLLEMPTPVITLSFMPMSHMVGNGFMMMTLGCGGTNYCSPKSDLSTLFEDFSLARPTMVSLVPRICEMLYQHFQRELDKRRYQAQIEPDHQADIEAEIKQEMREQLLGGRLLSVGSGSAALAPEIYVFMESMLDMHMPIGYSSTEIGGGTVLVDNKIQRPLVADYKLKDVPELGYFSTDKPFPRGELCVKTNQFMGGYFKRPELTREKVDADGFYHTGDVMAELGPDELIFVDRSNNVIKLSQGEFVPVAKLEAAYTRSPLIKQIYIYGTSERAYLLAVVVPTDEPMAELQQGKQAFVKTAIRHSMQSIADEIGLNGYEIPRDFILETESFSHANGLISEIGKHLRPKLKERYRESLEQMYAEIAANQVDEMRSLKSGSAERPVIDTVIHAVAASLAISTTDIHAEDRFNALGGDSLNALDFSKSLQHIFDVEVPVGVIIDPTADLNQVANYISHAKSGLNLLPSFTSVHGDGQSTVFASDLTLEKFIEPELLANHNQLSASAEEIKTVLITGVTGFLGRFLTLSWLENLADKGGKVIVIVRAANQALARQRVLDVMASSTVLSEHFSRLADEHLEVIAGDLGAARLGLSDDTWQALATRVDAIVHSGALVNHRLPYTQLFSANVVGTAELIRLALTGKLKRLHYISTLGVSMLCQTGLVDEHSDIRLIAPQCDIKDSYANGYNLSKWASEVLLREAHTNCGLPVSVFRPGMILAHSHYPGQINIPDMFTRLLFSLAVTGLAPATFYAQDLSHGRPQGRYEGYSVDFLANAIVAISNSEATGFNSYNLANPHKGGTSLDDIVDWMIAAGCNIQRLDNYNKWLTRFETALQALPDKQRQQSLLALLAPYRNPQLATAGPTLQCDHFQAAAHNAGFMPPALSQGLIEKYVADLHYTNLIS